MSTAIDRVKSALEACPHKRGLNGTKRKVAVAGKEHVVTHDPLVGVTAADLVELAASIPEADRSQIARDLHMGASAVPASQEVHVKVDDAWHLVEAAHEPNASGNGVAGRAKEDVG